MARKKKSVSSGPTDGAEPAAEQPTVKAADKLAPEELRARLQSLRPFDDERRPVKLVASFLTFWIAGEEYALPLARAREIARCESVTKVPNTPPWLRGVTNVRGSVVPVIDLAPRLGRSETAIGRGTSLLLVDVDWTGEAAGMGVLVEVVGRVVIVDSDTIEAVPLFGTRLRPDLLQGMVPVDGRFASVLDVDRALGAEELLPRTPSQGGWTESTAAPKE